MLATMSVASAAQIQNQTVCTSTAPTLKSFSPVDSLFPNPTATSFTIKLVNTVSGCPSEYRVSRFSDFHDATWTTYSASPTTVVQRTSFPPVADGSTSITLYFQVRVKNPQGGLPLSTSGGTLTTQPMFFTSTVLGRRIRLIFFG